jgi:hypothetical protein
VLLSEGATPRGSATTTAGGTWTVTVNSVPECRMAPTRTRRSRATRR